MNFIQKAIRNIDTFQQGHRLPGFTYAVIKKYGEDQSGYQAALLTYYSFLSLFPLLLVLTTVTDSIAHSHPHLQATIIRSMTDYFPVLGNQLSEHVHTIHKSGLALVVGIVFTLYGARGVAAVFRHGVNHIWQVPKRNQDSLPKTILKNLGLVIIGGLGFLAASISAGLAAAAGHGIAFRLLSVAVNVFILFWLFVFLLNVSLPRHVTVKETRVGAATAAVGLVILQALGSYLLVRELKSLDALYSYFAIALGLLFWIYLQAQVLYYSVEVATVHAQQLWPRSLTGRLTPADEQVHARQAARGQTQ
ncbi:MAG TPA: YihY/virulence factor BrkB family protein [Verrucomicrobiae bacterium]|jgi:YihY family inner membrane protein|nr:YihY/virulence factor BrkB family protein [Verrucomicrobiae bacterium]